MIKHCETKDGYEFYLANELLAVGSYSEKGFELCDRDDHISIHGNGMTAKNFLEEKYLGQKPRSEVNLPIFTPSKPLDQVFSKHPALVGVSPTAFRK